MSTLTLCRLASIVSQSLRYASHYRAAAVNLTFLLQHPRRKAPAKFFHYLPSTAADHLLEMHPPELPPGEFILDPRIALWALLPISVATLCMALLRRSLTVLGTDRVPQTLPKIRDATTLGRAANLRISGNLIAREQFLVRKQYFVNERTGVLAKPRPAPTATSAAALMSPQTMANQVTGMLSMLLPQMILGAWARYLFAGTAVCRLPFMLSERFRAMLQTGMEAVGQGVGVHYVSALSWYILNLFGNPAVVYVLTYGSDKVDAQPNMGALLAISMNPGKVFADERKSLLAVNHSNFLDTLEDKLIES